MLSYWAHMVCIILLVHPEVGLSYDDVLRPLGKQRKTDLHISHFTLTSPTLWFLRHDVDYGNFGVQYCFPSVASVSLELRGRSMTRNTFEALVFLIYSFEPRGSR